MVSKIGILICYDVEFPEISRVLALKGAKIICISAAMESLFHWKIAARARALENTCFILACNRAGKENEIEYVGHSHIVKPDGKILASLGYDEGILIKKIDLSDIEISKKNNSYIEDFRFDLFQGE